MRKLLLLLWKYLPLPLSFRYFLMWLINAKFLLGVVAVIASADGRVLMLHHTYRRRFPWGLPSGWARHGEEPYEALRREVFEETKLAVEMERIVDVRREPLAAVEVVYLCRPVPGSELRLTDPEVDGASWCLPDNLPEGTLPGQERLIREALGQSLGMSPRP